MGINMGCIMSNNNGKLKCPPNYDTEKFQAVCMIFDDLDFNGNRVVGTNDLAQGFDSFIHDFFLNREANLDNQMEINQNVKKKKKLKALENNKKELINVKKNLDSEVELNKNELNDKVVFKEKQIKSEHDKLDNIIKEYRNFIEISKQNLEKEAQLKFETLNTELENQIRACEKFYQDKYNRLKSEKTQINDLLKNDNKEQTRLRFIQYLNNQQENKNEFTINDCLLYFKNKSFDETM